MQEFAAEELMARKWRYHKVKRLWLTRDDTYPNPVEVERGVSERGVYCWWDATVWKKVRVCINLATIWCGIVYELTFGGFIA